MAGQLVLTGRAKDTIVLAGGENVSPQPIEDTICQSPIIKHAMLCGQDKRTLGVLVGLDQDDFKRYLQVCSHSKHRHFQILISDIPADFIHRLRMAHKRWMGLKLARQLKQPCRSQRHACASIGRKTHCSLL
jgi:long-subunit acyl-CoA synthetase (AMP-forming)